MSLGREEKLFLQVINSLSSPLAVVGPDYKVLASNRSFQDQYIFEQDKPCYALLHNRQQPCGSCGLEAGLVRRGVDPAPVKGKDRGQKINCFSALGRDIGDLDPAQILCCPVQGVPGHVLIVGLVSKRIADLAQSLRQANKFLHSLLLSSVDAVIAADLKGNILIFNNAASQVLGYSQEQALQDLNIRDIYPLGRAREVMKALRGVAHGGPGKLKDYQVEVVNKQGELVPISLNASIVYDPPDPKGEGQIQQTVTHGSEVATLGFFRDLRENKRLEKELEEARLQLFQSAKMAALGKLAAGVAHQINNPLSGISLFAQLLLEDYELEEGAKEDVQRILEDAIRCRDTVKELLEFARQSGGECKPQDINQIIERTLFLLEKQALFQDIEIVKEFDQSLPKISCDFKQLGHVFMNLVLNAAEAMDGHGRLIISTSRQEGEVLLAFQDNGPGIPKEALPHVFDPFYTTKEEGKGTGLGLSIAYRIIQSHGGKIWVKNLEPRGAVFYITLPLSENVEEAEIG